MSMLTARQRHKRDTLRSIERVAESLFSEKGFEATSTREIAKGAGIATGTLFNYFPDKRSVLVQLFRRRLDQALVTAFASEPSNDIETRLMRAFTTLNAVYEEDRRLGRAFLKELLFIDGPTRTDVADWTFDVVQRLAAIVRSAQDSGELHAETDPLAAAQQLFSTHYFSLVTWLGGTVPSIEARDQQLRFAVSITLRGLRRH